MDTTTRKPDYVLLATTVGMVALGLVMVYSASFVDAFTNHDNQLYYLLRQLVGAMLGTIGLLVAQRMHYTVWRRYSVHLMTLALVLLALVLVLPSNFTRVNESRAWLRLGPLSMQPSEVAKLALIVYFADWLSRRGEKLNNVTYGLIPFGVMLGVVCGLVMLEPDLGTTVMLVMIAGTVYFAAGANLLHLAGAVALAGGAFWAFIKATGKVARLEAFQDPWKDYAGTGWQTIHALYALGSGGVFGEGLGQARQKFQWLPQAHTDAIFAIIGEELGLLGTLVVLGAFLLLAYRGFRIAGRAPDPFAALVAVGITSWITFQALLNIAVITMLVPFTGITLPFFSYGNSSLVMCMTAMGVLLNISRHAGQRATQQEAPATPLLQRLRQRFTSARVGQRKPAAPRRAAAKRPQPRVQRPNR
ncbi:MAG: putative lipid II flippase FtsW [Chloroflexales bacterium]|nr:putative lipid II flippase FtsW [Chloroflexales bacterium]